MVLVASKDIDSPAINTIFEGILTRDKQSTLLVADDVNETIKQRIPLGDAIIVLGQPLIEQITSVGNSSQIIGGAFYGASNNPAGIPTLSLEPSLNTVVSEIRKTGFELTGLRTVVSSPSNIVDNSLFAQDADELSVVLSPTVVTGERDFARAWFALLQDIDPEKEAILVSDEKYMDSSGAYRYILETAWKRDILVVSTLPQYSRRGVAIGFIPDLLRYGQKLHDLVADRGDSQSDTGTQELWTDASLLNRVFNHRTLVHIGLRLPSDIDRLNGIDLVIE